MMMLTGGLRIAGGNRHFTMTPISEDFPWQLPPNNRFGLAHRKPLPWWRRPTAPRALPLLMEMLAILLALSVLFTFYQVVRNSVLKGDLLREAMAERALAIHHCNNLSASGAGASCLLRLNSPPTPGLAPIVASAAPGN
jgi:hypothetical protein